MGALYPDRTKNELREVFTTVDPVDEAPEALFEALRVEVHVARVGADTVQRLVEFGANGRDVPERQRRRDEGDDLAVVRAGVAPNHSHRIFRDTRFDGALRTNLVEGTA